MKTRIDIFASLLIISFSISAFADAGWTGYAQVTELTSTNLPYFLVTLKSSENLSGCRNKSVYYCDFTSIGSEQMFKTLLGAVTSGKMVRLYVTGNCELNGYSEISEVSIIP